MNKVKVELDESVHKRLYVLKASKGRSLRNVSQVIQLLLDNYDQSK